MPLRIFVSHSVAARELALVNGVADIAAQRGAIPIIPDRAWTPPEPLPERIAAQIRSSDYVIAIASMWGRHIDWLNQELEFSRRILKPIVIIADAKITIPAEYQCVRIDRANLSATLSDVASHIARRVQDKQMQNLLAGILIGGLALLLLSSKGE